MRAKPAQALPPLPASVFSLHGPLEVRLVENLRDPEPPHEQLFGFYNAFTRTISVRLGMHPTTMWLTLFHEQTHADIAEIGVALTNDQEEAVCNAIAAARVAEMLSGRTP